MIWSGIPKITLQKKKKVAGLNCPWRFLCYNTGEKTQFMTSMQFIDCSFESRQPALNKDVWFTNVSQSYNAEYDS